MSGMYHNNERNLPRILKSLFFYHETNIAYTGKIFYLYQPLVYRLFLLPNLS